MAPVNGGQDRRRAVREVPGYWGWHHEAILRPGVAVRVVDLSPRGARVDAPARLRPGRPAELQLAHEATDERRVLRGRVGRCRVCAIHPLRFEGTIEFDGPVSLQADQVPETHAGSNYPGDLARD